MGNKGENSDYGDEGMSLVGDIYIGILSFHKKVDSTTACTELQVDKGIPAE